MYPEHNEILKSDNKNLTSVTRRVKWRKWQHNECPGRLGSCLAGWAQICHCVQADYGCGEALFLSLWIPNIIVYFISPRVNRWRTTCVLYLFFWIHLSSQIISQQEFNNRWRTTSAPLLSSFPPSCSRSTLPCHLAPDQSSAFLLKVFLRHT